MNKHPDPAGPMKLVMWIIGTIVVLVGVGILIGIGLSSIYMC